MRNLFFFLLEMILSSFFFRKNVKENEHIAYIHWRQFHILYLNIWLMTFIFSIVHQCIVHREHNISGYIMLLFFFLLHISFLSLSMFRMLLMPLLLLLVLFFFHLRFSFSMRKRRNKKKRISRIAFCKRHNIIYVYKI